MLYIIAFVVIAIIAVAIIKAVGEAILRLVGGMEYIRTIIESSIVDTLSRRQKITNEMYLQSMRQLLLEAETA